MTKYYPIMLDIANKRCFVIGGGKVALRKVNSLISYNAQIIVISPHLCNELMSLYEQEKINWIQRNYNSEDIQEAGIVFAATDNEQVNNQIGKDAHEKGIMVNVADSPDMCNFIVPSKVERGDLTI